ncbi:MAG: hypothetical protein H6598_06365 [Flavobacteriales bacterium]|nr:hypothetical protein [Flavobacteriales bacterium]
MKTIFKLLSIGLLVAGISVNTNYGQNLDPMAVNTPNYKTAIGVRGGETSGLTIKHFMNSHTALEGIVGVWNRGFSGTLLIERHQQAFNVDGLRWYYGFGGHATVVGNRYVWYNNGRRYAVYGDERIGLGIDGIAGIEYKIPKAPFALSFDLKPYVEVVSNGNVWMSLDPGLGIKVTF